MGVYACGKKLWIRFRDGKGMWRDAATGYSVGQEERAQTMHDETVARTGATTKIVKHVPARGLTVRGFVAEWLPKRRERGLGWKADEGRLNAMGRLGVGTWLSEILDRGPGAEAGDMSARSLKLRQEKWRPCCHFHGENSKMIARTRKLPDESCFLFGSRRTGKSTWVKQVLPDALRVDLLKESTYSQLVGHADRLESMADARGIETIVIDEVQKLPPLLDEVPSADRGGGEGEAYRGKRRSSGHEPGSAG